jgi:hypothetical protein
MRFPRSADARLSEEIAMTFGKLLSSLVLLSIACAADAQGLKQRKPGLWELQYTAEGPAMQAEQERFRNELASMPPEKRARVEALMKQRGTGPGGAPVGQMRFCLTPEDLAEQSSSGYLKGLNDESNCKSKILSESVSEVRIHATCRNPKGGTREVDTRVYDISADHYAVDMTSRGTGNDMHMQQKARWIGGDCKGAF